MRRLSLICMTMLLTITLTACNKEVTETENTTATDETIIVEPESTTESVSKKEPTIIESTEQETTTKSALADMDLSDVVVPTISPDSGSTGDIGTDLSSGEDWAYVTSDGEYIWEPEVWQESYMLDWDKATLYDGFTLLIPVGYEHVYYMDGWDTYVSKASGAYVRSKYIPNEDGAPYDKLYEAFELSFASLYDGYSIDKVSHDNTTVPILSFENQGLDTKAYNTMIPWEDGYVYIEFWGPWETDVDFNMIFSESR